MRELVELDIDATTVRVVVTWEVLPPRKTVEVVGPEAEVLTQAAFRAGRAVAGCRLQTAAGDRRLEVWVGPRGWGLLGCRCLVDGRVIANDSRADIPSAEALQETLGRGFWRFLLRPYVLRVGLILGLGLSYDFPRGFTTVGGLGRMAVGVVFATLVFGWVSWEEVKSLHADFLSVRAAIG